MKKTLLITGGAGFVGSHVAYTLAKKGFHTFVIDDLSTGDKNNVIISDLIEGDFGDKSLLKALFSQYDFTAVCHFAAYSDLRESIENPKKTYDENVQKTLNLLEVILDKRRIPFLFSSSAAVYGNHLPFTEESEPHPLTPYGKSKLFIEEVLFDFERAYKLPFFAFRYFNAAGGISPIKHTNENDFHLIPKALRQLKKGEPITIFGDDHNTQDGTCIRDYIHVKDIALAHQLVLENAFPSGVYNLGSGKGYSVLEVLNTIEKITKKPLLKQFSQKREGDPPYLVACNQKAKEVMGFTPQRSSLAEIIQDAWEALK